MNYEIWLRIITIHQYAKDLLIKCEEIDSHQLSGFIQPFKEQRDALEHIMRAQAAFYDINDDISDDVKEKYINWNLEKALGH